MRYVTDIQYQSKRARQWIDFAKDVTKHIDRYTVKQYGDYPYDQMTSATEEDICFQLKKYVNRLRSNARGEEEARRDLLKIAHYAQLLDFCRREKSEAEHTHTEEDKTDDA